MTPCPQRKSSEWLGTLEVGCVSLSRAQASCGPRRGGRMATHARTHVHV